MEMTIDISSTRGTTTIKLQFSGFLEIPRRKEMTKWEE